MLSPQSRHINSNAGDRLALTGLSRERMPRLTLYFSSCSLMCLRSFSRQPALTTRYTSVPDTCARKV